ncbi:hypothetical protein Tco_1570592 [Tanacetum coccineum]|uniref:Uncharacterized protein n=1 Tax=Tanacetum coccineum TaxID=301880 RepID=A0ABQ5F8H0_9ASTR
MCGEERSYVDGRWRRQMFIINGGFSVDLWRRVISVEECGDEEIDIRQGNRKRQDSRLARLEWERVSDMVIQRELATEVTGIRIYGSALQMRWCSSGDGAPILGDAIFRQKSRMSPESSRTVKRSWSMGQRLSAQVRESMDFYCRWARTHPTARRPDQRDCRDF